jgi:hypothetical protein
MFPEAARTRIAQCSRNIPRALETRCYSANPKQNPTVAVLFQDIDPPVINGVRKPRKPGGEFHHNILVVSISITYLSQRLPGLWS